MMNEKTPSQEYGLPVIGKIYCQLTGTINGKDFKSPVDEYEVIKVIDNGDNKTYVCNQWNSPGVVQVVPDICVLRYEEF